MADSALDCITTNFSIAARSGYLAIKRCSGNGGVGSKEFFTVALLNVP